MKWFEIRNETKESADLFIFDRIGGGFWDDGTSGKKFINSVNKVKDKKINLHINSPGGSVFDGLTIYNYLLSVPDVHIFIEGLAASI